MTVTVNVIRSVLVMIDLIVEFSTELLILLLCSSLRGGSGLILGRRLLALHCQYQKTVTVTSEIEAAVILVA